MKLKNSAAVRCNYVENKILVEQAKGKKIYKMKK